MASTAEITAKSLLEGIGFKVKRHRDASIDDLADVIYAEYPLPGIRIDFALPHARIAIEIEGDYWHNTNSDQKLYRHQIERQIGDRRKSTILKEHNWKLIRVFEKDLGYERGMKHLYLSILRLLDI